MYAGFVKRTADIIVSIIGLPFLLLFIVVIGLMIKLEDRGPVFYSAERIGKDNRLFKMLKFRSMKVNAECILNSDGSTYNSKNDPRVTKIGKFIRETSIDELPQLLNVLKGDMSLIGPRASLGSAVDSFLEDETDKMKVRPGITGYSQAYFRNDISKREKRLKDAWYANHVSFALDVKILFRTVITVCRRQGLYTNSENAPEGRENSHV